MLGTRPRAQLSLDRTLAVLIEIAADAPIKQLLIRVRDGVHSGATLSAAMEAQAGVFSRLYLSMLKAGEAGGTVETVLMHLSEYLERARELRETVTSALIYPAILLSVAGLSVIVLLVYVVPQFQQLFDDAGQALPLTTQVVIFLGDGLRDYGWFLILGAAALGWYVRGQLAQPATRFRWDARLLRLPLAGDLIIKSDLAFVLNPFCPCRAF